MVDSIEGRWNSGREENPNLGYKPRYKEGYFPVPPTDSLMDLRNEMVLNLMKCGIDVEAQHHEVASGGQCEIDLRFQPLVRAADQLLMFKYIVKNTAKMNNKTVTYMPKPVFGDNGSGMHVHTSLWKKGKPLFAGTGYAGLSETGLYFIGGILKHAASLLSFTNPLKLLLTWLTLSETEVPQSEFRCILPVPNQRELNSAVPILQAILILLFLQCLWQD
jgi:glutamine synthetase